MKFLALVFVFAFVAVQFSCSAPAPDDDKKEEAPGSPAKGTDPTVVAAEVKSAARDQGAAGQDAAQQSHGEEKEKKA